MWYNCIFNLQLFRQGSQRKIHFLISLSYLRYVLGYVPDAYSFLFILVRTRLSFSIETFLPVISLNESVTCFQSSLLTIFTGADLFTLSNMWSLSMAWIRFSSVRLSASPYFILTFLPSEKGREEKTYVTLTL